MKQHHRDFIRVSLLMTEGKLINFLIDLFDTAPEWLLSWQKKWMDRVIRHAAERIDQGIEWMLSSLT